MKELLAPSLITLGEDRYERLEILNQISDRNLERRELHRGGMEFCERYGMIMERRAGKLLYVIWNGAEEVQTSFSACHLGPTIIGFEFGRIRDQNIPSYLLPSFCICRSDHVSYGYLKMEQTDFLDR